ncbi:hypothetical protein F8G81_07790 [Arthrobacter sp. CDRTa11]|uniref:hypothetical protein n=1 Tax=Arthrobacter sp. CDRTa11 TaxID=2651199 RepID=UPI0022657EC8|nr:hypothetical protein [Arthrobacter sp. CDRTa11]UZX02531.1 hypothetical protein F8G81_07790 [Arthrobacter sp. CDRTa11]
MNALWIAAALLVAGFAGWPVTALVFRLARTIDDRADAATASDEAARRAAEDPSADVTVDTVIPGAVIPGAGQTVDGELTAETGHPTSGVPGIEPPAPTQRILRGGAIIGVLERLGVCLAILTGQPVAIAYIVAIKGLGRFAELKETPVAAERFIIGTLTSMLWAAGIAATVKVLFLG